MTDPLHDLLEEARRQCLEARELTDCPKLRLRLTAISALLEQAHISSRLQTARRRRPDTKRAALIDWLKPRWRERRGHREPLRMVQRRLISRADGYSPRRLCDRTRPIARPEAINLPHPAGPKAGLSTRRLDILPGGRLKLKTVLEAELPELSSLEIEGLSQAKALKKPLLTQQNDLIQQRPRTHLESHRNFLYRNNRRVARATLDARDVGTMVPRSIGKLLLRPALFFPEAFHV